MTDISNSEDEINDEPYFNEITIDELTEVKENSTLAENTFDASNDKFL
jgi:hypothetical protein